MDPDSAARQRRLLRQAAAAAATAELEDTLVVGSAATLSSPLLAELCQGLQGLSIQSPSRALSGLPSFLSRTRIRHLDVSASGPAASAQADSVLRHCDTVTSLTWHLEFFHHFWPPNITQLDLRNEHWEKATDAAATAELQLMQLLRLQDTRALRQLSLTTGAVCHWPAYLAGSLPGRLLKVHMRLCVPDQNQLLDPDEGLDQSAIDGMVDIDLSAFSQAAGCTAELDISLFGPHPFAVEDSHDSIVPGILADLCAVGSFHVLHLDWRLAHVAEHALELSEMQCSRCVLTPACQGRISRLPTIGHLTLAIKRWADIVGPLICEWAALASPGVRCLGSAAQPICKLVVNGCPGLVPTGQPWALAIWAGLSDVRGLPTSSFVEEAPGMHVWRNAAGAGLDVSSQGLAGVWL